MYIPSMIFRLATARKYKSIDGLSLLKNILFYKILYFAYVYFYNKSRNLIFPLDQIYVPSLNGAWIRVAGKRKLKSEGEWYYYV